MSKTYTHIGLLVGADNRTPDNWVQTVMLRETQFFWITEQNDRYRKGDGTLVGGNRPKVKLNLSSVRPLS